MNSATMNATLSTRPNGQPPPRPQRAKIYPENIPDELKQKNNWAVWKYKLDEKNKWTKEPFQVNGSHAKSNTPATWCDFQTALRAAQYPNSQFDGIESVCGDVSIIDLDHCIDDDGIVSDFAREIVDTTNTYTEITPSGHGLRLIFHAKLPPEGRVKKNPDIEMYDSVRFFTVTGNHVLSSPLTIEYRQDEINALHKRIFGEPKPKVVRPLVSGVGGLSLDDDEILDKMFSDKHSDQNRRMWNGDASDFPKSDGTPDESVADFHLCQHIAFYSNGDENQIDRMFRHSGLMRDKWDEQHGTSTYGERTIARAVAKTTDFYHKPVSKMSSNGHGKPVENETKPAPQQAKEVKAYLQETEKVDGLYAFLQEHKYIYEPTGKLFPAISLDNALGYIGDTPVSKWLDKNRAVQQLTWSPAHPKLIEDMVIDGGGWRVERGNTCYNQYKPPRIEKGNPNDVQKWLDHIHTLYGDEGNHIIKWFAQRVQNPGVKINHALVLGGEPGIGKDTIISPLRYAIGEWNFSEVSPSAITGRFNKFVKSVVLRVNEARDLGEVNRHDLYEHMKTYTAAPPEAIPVEQKFIEPYEIPNIVGVIVTTNHRTDGLYLPANDRRHYVVWSDCKQGDFTEEYWTEIYTWYENGGYANVAAYLAEFDLSKFNPKVAPPKTSAFWDIVNANRAPEESELSDILDQLGKPDPKWKPNPENPDEKCPIIQPNVLVLDMVLAQAEKSHYYDFHAFVKDRRNSRTIPHRLEAVGYSAVHNDTIKDGFWVIKALGGKRRVIYAKKDLPQAERIECARKLQDLKELPEGEYPK